MIATQHDSSLHNGNASDIVEPKGLLSFGNRLRAERKRLGLSQTELAAVAGVKRLAQGGYEVGQRYPGVDYLYAVQAAGADLHFLLAGVRDVLPKLSPAEKAQTDKDAFQLVEDYVRIKCGGHLSAESRYVLFDIIRKQLTLLRTLGGDESALTQSYMETSDG